MTGCKSIRLSLSYRGTVYWPNSNSKVLCLKFRGMALVNSKTTGTIMPLLWFMANITNICCISVCGFICTCPSIENMRSNCTMRKKTRLVTLGHSEQKSQHQFDPINLSTFTGSLECGNVTKQYSLLQCSPRCLSAQIFRADVRAHWQIRVGLTPGRWRERPARRRAYHRAAGREFLCKAFAKGHCRENEDAQNQGNGAYAQGH